MNIEEHLRNQWFRYLVQKTMFCPITNEVLDVRTCIVLVDSDGDPTHVFSPNALGALKEKASELSALGYELDESTLPS